MKIGFIYKDHEKSILFVNLAKYLELLGHQVIFLNPRPHVLSYLKTNKLEWTNYPDNECHSYLQKGGFDRLIFWNGSFNIETNIAKKLQIPSWFLEQGYWQSSTIQMNKGGVNYAADFSKLSAESLLSFAYNSVDMEQINFTPARSIPTPYYSYGLYKLRQLFSKDHYLFFTSIRALLITKLARIKHQYPHVSAINISSLKPYLFFPLQVSEDTQLIYNSPYSSMSQVVSLFLKKYNGNDSIVLKEHPKETSLTNYTKFISKKLYLTKKTNLEELSKSSKFVININSSVGMQALEQHKKVLHLGNSFYQNFPGVISCNLLHCDLNESIRELVNLDVDWHTVDKLISHFKETIFLTGSWRKPSRELLHSISERALS